jgi:hypothetical protein
MLQEIHNYRAVTYLGQRYLMSSRWIFMWVNAPIGHLSMHIPLTLQKVGDSRELYLEDKFLQDFSPATAPEFIVDYIFQTIESIRACVACKHHKAIAYALCDHCFSKTVVIPLLPETDTICCICREPNDETGSLICPANKHIIHMACRIRYECENKGALTCPMCRASVSRSRPVV